MKRWSGFAAEAPDLAEAGRALLHPDHTLVELLIDRALHVPDGVRPSGPLRDVRWQAA